MTWLSFCGFADELLGAVSVFPLGVDTGAGQGR